jgi:hypothetical protein
MSISSVGSSGCNPLQQAMSQLFSKSDANTDGKLDTSEISSLLDALNETSASSDSGLTADKVVSAFDTDGDGSVSGSEFDAGFKKLGEQMQSTLIAMQEDGQRPPPPPGGMGSPPPGASDDDEEDDSSTSTVSDLMKLLESYSSSDDTEETASTGEEDTLAQLFLSQLEKYAKAQDYQSGFPSRYGSQSSSSVSLSV